MHPNVTQSFKLRIPDLESCRAEAMLRLFIVEHFSAVWKHATIWKRSSRTVCHTKNEVSCSYVAQYVDGNNIVGPKSVVAKIDIFSPCSLRASARLKINTPMLHNFIGFF